MMTIDTFIPGSGPVRIGDRTFTGIGAVPLGVWAKVFVAIMRARLAKRRVRRHVRTLSEDQLNDIGLTRDLPRYDAVRPIWWYRK